MKKEIYDEMLMLVCISHWLTVSARGTYEVGTENVLKPSALRAYNEAQHRITAAIIDRLAGADFMSLQDTFEILDILGKEYGETDNIEFFLDEAFRCCRNLNPDEAKGAE